MATLKYDANSSFQTGTLGSSYTSGGGSLSLTAGHGARFPSSGDFWVRVDDEIFKVTSRSTDTLTVTGARDSTSASNHSSGATVTWVLSVSALTQLRADMLSSGVGASNSLYDTFATIAATTPSSDAVGQLAFCSDSPYSARWSGSAWQWFVKGFPVTLPPSAGWSWQGTQGGATVDQTYGYIYLKAPANGADNVRRRSRSVTLPYTVTALIGKDGSSINFGNAGLFVEEAGVGDMTAYGLLAANGVSVGAYYHSSQTGSGSARGTHVPIHDLGLVWLKIVNNSTNRIYSYSITGQDWITYLSEAFNNDLAEDKIGLQANSNNNIAAATICYSWVQT